MIYKNKIKLMKILIKMWVNKKNKKNLILKNIKIKFDVS